MNTPGINPKKDNIFKVTVPYYLAMGHKQLDPDKNIVIFFGADYRHLQDEVDKEEFVRLSNLCLDYIRRECVGCQLLYKPHPAEIEEEYSRLNLNSFELVKDTTIGEVYLMQRLNSVKCVFSVCSWVSLSAYNMGANSYVFSRLFDLAFGAVQSKFYQDYFEKLPDNFFISNFGQKLSENKITLKKDENLERHFEDLIGRNDGNFWFVIIDPAFLSIVLPLSNLIKKITPKRGINLIISRHHRWDVMNMDQVRSFFDKTVIFPRPFYSLRPAKVLKAVKTALAIKKLKIASGDVIIGFCNSGFVENCLVSYNPENVRISAQFTKNIEMMYGFNQHELFDEKSFRQTKSNLFFNKILEPLLGLNRTLYLKYGDGTVFNISRYEKPLNDVYDKVYLFENAKGLESRI